MPNHTPGPWQADMQGDGFWQIWGRQSTPIVRIRPAYAWWEKEKQVELAANARLIAAAPELAEVLRDTLAVIDSLMPGIGYIAVEDYAKLNDVPLRARRILAKLDT